MRAAGPECHLQRSGGTEPSPSLLPPGLGLLGQKQPDAAAGECWESWQGCRAGHQQVNQLSNKNKILFCNSCSQWRPPEIRVVGHGEFLVWLLHEEESGHRALVLLPGAAQCKTLAQGGGDPVRATLRQLPERSAGEHMVCFEMHP